MQLSLFICLHIHVNGTVTANVCNNPIMFWKDICIVTLLLIFAACSMMLALSDQLLKAIWRSDFSSILCWQDSISQNKQHCYNQSWLCEEDKVWTLPRLISRNLKGRVILKKKKMKCFQHHTHVWVNKLISWDL